MCDKIQYIEIQGKENYYVLRDHDGVIGNLYHNEEWFFVPKVLMELSSDYLRQIKNKLNDLNCVKEIDTDSYLELQTELAEAQVSRDYHWNAYIEEVKEHVKHAERFYRTRRKTPSFR